MDNLDKGLKFILMSRCSQEKILKSVPIDAGKLLEINSVPTLIKIPFPMRFNIFLSEIILYINLIILYLDCLRFNNSTFGEMSKNDFLK